MPTSKESGSGVIHECFYRCDSRAHASNLTAAVTKASLSDEKVAAYLKWCCVKYAQALDSNGRSLIHVAAAMGRLKLLMFLLTHREVNINFKDQESFYTALHRSLFYGQLHCAVRLIQSGASLQQSDLDDLTPSDHVMKDRSSILTYSANQPCEVYVWGTNTNYTLGIGHHYSRSNPEPLDYFRKENISIKQALMSKFHSLFLGSDRKVWSCGLGSGGRLGLGDEATTLVPRALQIGSNSSESCKVASVGIDHSILLMENGSVWSFGLNNYHQLGHVPPPDKVLFPKAIKSFKGLEIIGISASKFHSVFWTKSQIFACGLHGGQLGHLKTSENTVAAPRIVAALQLKESNITQVATSDGATVVVNSKRDIYLFHGYRCKKLTTKTCKLAAKKICVVGGHLDHRVYSRCLQEKGGDELKILILTEHNTIHLWQESCPQLNRCLLSLHRYVDFTDVALNRASLILTTKDGEAFYGEIKKKKKKTISENEKPSSPNPVKLLVKDDYDYIKLKRIPHVHRAVNATCDFKGRNFAVVQVHPKAGLLEIPFVEATEMKENFKSLLSTATEFDTLHDVIFQVNGVRFPAHRYVVSHSCDVLGEMINRAEVVDDVRFVRVADIEPQIFQRVLYYLYTGECDLLQIGVCPVRFESTTFHLEDEVPTNTDVIEEREEISSFENQKRHRQRLGKKNSGRKTDSKAKDPIRSLKDAARTFELTGLVKNLESLRYNNGSVCQANDKNLDLHPPQFKRKNLQNLWDISLKSESGSIIKAHKCVLVARLEYFNCMFNQGWLESSLKTPLSLPFPDNVLDIFVRYLYTDEAPEIKNSDDPDLASHILVIADQFFCTRLKEIAEIGLAKMINLKNAAEVMQLAVTYNATQLKQCAMEFICLNLSALLESRSLEILEDLLLTDLRDFYRSRLRCMSRRNIATDSDTPDDDFVNSIYLAEPVSLEKAKEETFIVKTSSKTSKKKAQREKKNNIELEKVRNASVSSTTSDEEFFGSLDFSDTGVKEETWIMVTNHSTKLQKSVQAKSKAPLPEVGSSKAVTVSMSKTPFIPVNVLQAPVRAEKSSFTEADKNVVLLSTSSDKEFPALSASAPEKITSVVSPKSSSENFKKFVKLSQKQRKRLTVQSVGEGEGSAKKSQETLKSVWGVFKIGPQSLADVIKEENNKNNAQCGSLAASPPWQGPSSPTCSLSAIMAAERQQRELATKMRTKPLEYTQMEDKAIDNLMLLYDVPNVTDERITVRRADSVFLSPPVWVSSHR